MSALLERVASFENLEQAYRECCRRKRRSLGFRKTVFNLGERLVRISYVLKENRYRWGPYREFYVCDPKRRKIMAAPFLDRVVHHAIHRVIEPLVDIHISDNVFACRHGRGNKFAAQLFFRRLKAIGSDRYVLKLDVSQYFASIRHDILLSKLSRCLPDDSLRELIVSLLGSYALYKESGRGLPIGNLTSQLFANFYLVDLDHLACAILGFPYYWLSEVELPMDCFYIRYMDDLVLVGRDKKNVCRAGARIVEAAHDILDLKIPMRKRMHIGADPVPFLGYRITHEEGIPLARNRRKIARRMRQMEKEKLRAVVYHGRIVVEGGRVGYSVRLISKSHLLSPSWKVGGEGGQEGPILNPPARDF